MKEQPKKFINASVNEPKVVEVGFDIPVGKILVGMTIGIVVIASMTVTCYSVYKEYKSWANAWNQVQFAKQHPEMVEVVKSRYEARLKGVQEEFTNATQSSTVEIPKE